MISREIIEELAAEELVDANTKHDPKFNSMHEAYAVLKEEVEEMFDDAETTVYCLGMLWGHIKKDDDCKEYLERIRLNAISAVQEGLQVIAMCDKALKLY